MQQYVLRLDGCGSYFGKELAHGGIYRGEGNKLVGHVYKCEIKSGSLRHGEIGAGQTVGLTDTAAHRHTVDGVAEAFLGYRNQKGYGGVG